MKKTIAAFILTMGIFLMTPSLGRAEIASVNNINIWYETFGKNEDPAFLLIMGSVGQGICWPNEFCQKLAGCGYYLIRYDQRDSGYSTCFDYQTTPYDLLDLAKDAAGLIDALNIEKAHLMGVSMGGPIAELVAAHFPEKVSTITLMTTSSDFRPINLLNAGLNEEEGGLSRPSQSYVNMMGEIGKMPAKTEEEKIQQRMAVWDLMSGETIEDKSLNHSLQKEFIHRGGNPLALLNYRLAMRRSEEMIKEVPFKVKVPTLIIQGAADPLFGPDHGEALNKAIVNSKYVLIQGMGHLPNSHFSDLLIEKIKVHAH